MSCIVRFKILYAAYFSRPRSFSESESPARLTEMAVPIISSLDWQYKADTEQCRPRRNMIILLRRARLARYTRHTHLSYYLHMLVKRVGPMNLSFFRRVRKNISIASILPTLLASSSRSAAQHGWFRGLLHIVSFWRASYVWWYSARNCSYRLITEPRSHDNIAGAREDKKKLILFESAKARIGSRVSRRRGFNSSF